MADYDPAEPTDDTESVNNDASSTDDLPSTSLRPLTSMQESVDNIFDLPDSTVPLNKPKPPSHTFSFSIGSLANRLASGGDNEEALLSKETMQFGSIPKKLSHHSGDMDVETDGNCAVVVHDRDQIIDVKRELEDESKAVIDETILEKSSHSHHKRGRRSRSREKHRSHRHRRSRSRDEEDTRHRSNHQEGDADNDRRRRSHSRERKKKKKRRSNDLDNSDVAEEKRRKGSHDRRRREYDDNEKEETDRSHRQKKQDDTNEQEDSKKRHKTEEHEEDGSNRRRGRRRSVEEDEEGGSSRRRHRRRSRSAERRSRSPSTGRHHGRRFDRRSRRYSRETSPVDNNDNNEGGLTPTRDETLESESRHYVSRSRRRDIIEQLMADADRGTHQVDHQSPGRDGAATPEMDAPGGGKTWPPVYFNAQGQVMNVPPPRPLLATPPRQPLQPPMHHHQQQPPHMMVNRHFLPPQQQLQFQQQRFPVLHPPSLMFPPTSGAPQMLIRGFPPTSIPPPGSFSRPPPPPNFPPPPPPPPTETMNNINPIEEIPRTTSSHTILTNAAPVTISSTPMSTGSLLETLASQAGLSVNHPPPPPPVQHSVTTSATTTTSIPPGATTNSDPIQQISKLLSSTASNILSFALKGKQDGGSSSTTQPKINSITTSSNVAPSSSTAVTFALPPMPTPDQLVKKKSPARLGDISLDDFNFDSDSKQLLKRRRSEFATKKDWQERIANEVKITLRPYYSGRKINRTEYKDVLKKAVTKIQRSNVGEIDANKTAQFVSAYCDKLIKAKKLEDKRTHEVTSSQ